MIWIWYLLQVLDPGQGCAGREVIAVNVVAQEAVANYAAAQEAVPHHLQCLANAEPTDSVPANVRKEEDLPREIGMDQADGESIQVQEKTAVVVARNCRKVIFKLDD